MVLSYSGAQAGWCEKAMADYLKGVAEVDAIPLDKFAPGAKEDNDALNRRIKANVLKGCAPGGFYDQADEAIQHVRQLKEELRREMKEELKK
jgi:hypothetical protein